MDKEYAMWVPMCNDCGRPKHDKMILLTENGKISNVFKGVMAEPLKVGGPDKDAGERFEIFS